MIAIRFGIYTITAQNVRFFRRSLFKSLITIAFYIHYVWVYFMTFKLSGYIEENPSPQPKSYDSLPICHWNLNSIHARSFIKFSLLLAYKNFTL